MPESLRTVPCWRPAFRSGIFNCGVVRFSPAEVERSKDPVQFMKIVQNITDNLKAAGLRGFIAIIHANTFDSDFMPVYWPHVHFAGTGYVPNKFTPGDDDDQRFLDLHVYGRTFKKTADKTVAELRAEARPLPRSGRRIWKGFKAFTDTDRLRRHLFYLLSHASILKALVSHRGRTHSHTHVLRYYGSISNHVFPTNTVLSNAHDAYSRLQELNKDGFSDRYMNVKNPYTCSRPAAVDSVSRVVLAGKCMLPVPVKLVKLGSLPALMPATVKHPRPEPLSVYAGMRLFDPSLGSTERVAHAWWPVVGPAAVARREKPADRRDDRSVWWPKAGFQGMHAPKDTSALPAKCLKRRPAVLGLVGRGPGRQPIVLIRSSKILFECVEVEMQYAPVPPDLKNLDISQIVLKDKPVLRFYKAQFDEAIKTKEPFVEPDRQQILTGTKPAFPKSSQIGSYMPKRDDMYVIVLRYRYRACQGLGRYRDKFAHRVLLYDPSIDRLCPYCHNRFKGSVPAGGMLPSDYDITKSGSQLVEPGSFIITSLTDDLVVGVPYYPSGSRVVAYAKGLKVLPSFHDRLTPDLQEAQRREYSVSVLRWACNVIRSGDDDVNRRAVYDAALRVVGKYGLPSLLDDAARNDFIGSVTVEYQKPELPQVDFESMLASAYRTIDSYA